MTTVRLLLVHGVAWRLDEGADVWELITGLLEADARADDGTRLRVISCDGWRVFDVALVDGQGVATPTGNLLGLLRRQIDIVHVWLPFPLRHLLPAALLRIQGRSVLLSSMSMLGEDFAAASWFREPSRLRRRLKPLLVRSLRAVWRLVATGWVVVSQEEQRQVRRLGPTATMSYPTPPTSLVGAADAPDSRPGPMVEAHRPLAFVARLDVHRKGLDRLGRWLLSYSDSLPKPAVLLFAPDGALPKDLAEAERQGLLRWDRATHGAALAPHLHRCRGVALLSRFDGQPRVVREAAYLGVPTLTTAASGFGDVVPALGIGVIVDGDEPASIQAGFELLADMSHDPTLAREFFDRRALGAFWRELLRDTVATGVLPARSWAEAFRAQRVPGGPQEHGSDTSDDQQAILTDRSGPVA